MINEPISQNSVITWCLILQDRIFWIYFIITFFFVVVGLSFIIASQTRYLIMIAILWVLSQIALLFMVYHASVIWGPCNPYGQATICFVDKNSGCFQASNRIWLLVNILYIALLIISVIWVVELANNSSDTLCTMSGVLILLGGLLLAALTCTDGKINEQEILFNNFNHLPAALLIPFWFSVAFLLIWVILSIYVVLE